MISEVEKAIEAIWNIPDEGFDLVIDGIEKQLKELINSQNLINRLRKDFLENKMSIPQIKDIRNSITKLGQEYLSKIDADSPKARYLLSLINTYQELFSKVINEGIAQTICVGIELTDENSKIPAYAHLSDAGCDVYALNETKIPAHGTVIVPTGIKLEIPDGFEVQVRPRSGMSVKTPILVVFGTLDSGYRGEVGVMAYNRSGKAYTIEAGERVAQLVLAPSYRMFFQVVPRVGETDRGENGFGSSGQ